ncbi:DUF3987 domain-containing protein [Paradesertivirga mongoliensis]|uniref:DUF3987 domain-containing protein n=1 Tax=Paradesertivirga mongoliensis TaxID=2100740 RepID=A0ABW4ZPJ3_9SPHI|nr:DUF3987 domain-containing protein [Pedobacter mongoliensis]
MGFHDWINTNRSTEVSTATTSDLRHELEKRDSQNNVFPLEIFHPNIKPFLNELHTKYDIPRSYIGLSMLITYSTAIGTAYAVSRNGSDRMTLCCWGCFNGISSSGKSLAMDMCMAPLNELQNDLDAEWDAETKGITDDARMRKFIKMIIYRDAYIPTLIRSIMPFNPKGVLKDSDEILEWINGLNSLGKKESTDEQFWISAWDGRKYSAIRSGNQKTNIPRVFTNVVGGIQPDLLYKLFKNDRGSSGFIFRLLFSSPEVFKIAQPEPGYDIPYELKQMHANHVKRMWTDLPVEDGYEEPKVCIMTKEATSLIDTWQRNKANEINQIRDTREMNVHSGILGKMKAYAYRFAGILAVSDFAFEAYKNTANVFVNEFGNLDRSNVFYPNELPITEKLMERAIMAAEYFFKSAVDIYEAVDNSITAPLEVMQMAALVKAGRSIQFIADALLDKRLTPKARKSAMNRKLKKAILDYPKVFGAVNN